jgi:hypothetical protein
MVSHAVGQLPALTDVNMTDGHIVTVTPHRGVPCPGSWASGSVEVCHTISIYIQGYVQGYVSDSNPAGRFFMAWTLFVDTVANITRYIK